MRWILLVLMGVHGLIHLMGFAKGFGYADLPQLTQPISRASHGTFTPRRFSTPVRDYRDFGPVRLMSFGEARSLLPDGEFTYGEFNLVDITHNGR
jgi:Family of unknown function (DUF6544)